MVLIYCMLEALLALLFAKIFIFSSTFKKILILIFLPIALNFAISLLSAFFLNNSFDYGYNVGAVFGKLLLSTIIMMIVLGLHIKVRKSEQQTLVEKRALVNGVQAQNVDQKPAIPVDEEGNPQYHKVSIERTIEDLSSPIVEDGEVYEFTEEEVDGLITANRDEAVKINERLLNNPPKIGTNKAKYLAEKSLWTKQIADMQARIDYWDNVLNFRVSMRKQHELKDLVSPSIKYGIKDESIMPHKTKVIQKDNKRKYEKVMTIITICIVLLFVPVLISQKNFFKLEKPSSHSTYKHRNDIIGVEIVEDDINSFILKIKEGVKDANEVLPMKTDDNVTLMGITFIDRALMCKYVVEDKAINNMTDEWEQDYRRNIIENIEKHVPNAKDCIELIMASKLSLHHFFYQQSGELIKIITIDYTDLE